MNVRNLIPRERLPKELRTGYEATAMPEWIWIAERNGYPVGILVAAPAHGVVILMRLATTPDAEGTDVRTLLVAAFREMKMRGYRGYTTWLDPTKEPENAFIRIIRAIGGFQLLNPQVACCGGL